MTSIGQMKVLFEKMREALIVTDEAGLIQTANEKTCSFLEMEKSDLRERHIHALLTPRQGEFSIEEVSRESDTGLIMWRLKQKGAGLRRESRRNSSEGTVMAALTHEIRTPMNGIVGMTDLALEEEVSPVLREYLDVIRLSADSLMRVINDILDYSKIESGKLTLEQIPFSFHSFMDEIIRMFSPQVKTKGLEFRYNPSTEIPDRIIGDPVRIRQIIQNLLNNALKFTREGHIEVSTCLDPETNPPRLYFYIADSGIGIPLNKQHLLFKSFTQVDSSTTRKYGGTGLGLAICAYLTNSMGGVIDVKSRAGKGSTFRFYIPLVLQKGDSPEEQSGTSEIPEESVSPGTCAGSAENRPVVLLMEDNRINQLLAVRAMEKAGYRVETADDGLEGIRKFETNRPDIVLLDIQMPNMDGYETAREIRRLEGESKNPVPIIAITALAMPEDRERILQSGMNDFLGKPVTPIDLKKVLNKYISN